jgi:hypothetical protein
MQASRPNQVAHQPLPTHHFRPFHVLLQASRPNQVAHHPLPKHHFRPFHQAHRLSNCSVTWTNNFSNFTPRNHTRKFQSSWVRFFSNSHEVIDTFNSNFVSSLDEAEDLAAIPMVWVSKWVNYSDKYGFFGYQLSDDTIGVIFNDLTKLLLHVDGK